MTRTRSSFPAKTRVLPALAAAFASAGLLLFSTSAEAYDTLAVPCVGDELYCQIAPIGFSRYDDLPIQFSFDTGWVPAGSPLQVHLFAAIYANTRVSLVGQLQTVWPEALTITTPGTPNGGLVYYHYGVELGADAMVSISVFGQNFSWTGNIPFVPQVDLQVEAETAFDAWGFYPGVTASSSSAVQKVAQIDVSSLIGASIPGISGGFELDVAVDFSATYVTDRVTVDPVEGAAAVVGGPIISDDGEVSTKPPQGPAVELDANVEGTVSYDGVLHLIPAFYVSLLGSNWNIPIADIPIAFPIADVPWIFDPVRVHVPLPDVIVPTETIDFGMVAIGEAKTMEFAITNAGEAGAAITVVSGDPLVFVPTDTMFNLDALTLIDSTMTFLPLSEGEFEAKIYVGSNDPADPAQAFLVKGNAYEGGALIGTTEPPPEGAAASDGLIDEDGSCACSAPGAEKGQSGGAGLASLLFLGAAMGASARRRKKASV